MQDSQNPEDSNSAEPTTAVDLSALHGFSFGPSWETTSAQSNAAQKAKTSNIKRTKRPKKRNFTNPSPPPFSNTLEISIFPEDEPFKKLCKAIRRSYVTYELFEIAQAILEKEDRFVIVLKPRPKKDSTLKQVYCSVPDKVPFMSEAEALAWFYNHHMENFFNVEETEQDPPKGTFTSISRCKATGELLGPPNYHRYQQLLQEHHATHLSHVPFEKFTNNLETEKTQEAIDEWLQKMTKVKKYSLKATENEETQTFDSLESAKRYLLTKQANKVVKSADTLRIPGTVLNKMPDTPLKQAIQHYIQNQQKFPLDTANNIRGRLRRMQFNIYKKGSKGVSYVCATKRKFRNSATPFADSITTLINFVDTNPLINIGDLRQKFLEKNPSQTPEASTSDNTPSSENKALIQLNTDLKWLLAEGFVIQYSDGRLLANPIVEPKKTDSPATEAGLPTADTSADKTDIDKPKAKEAKETSCSLDTVIVENVYP